MANYSTLKAAVADVVKTNGSQAITGANLQTVLLSIINSIGGGGYIFNGIATPSTDAGTPDQNVFYIGGAGTYANFGTSVVVPPTNIAVFKYNGSWTCEQVTVDTGGVFDISAFKAIGGTLATYADLAAALGTGGANVPEGVRKGGMSIKYVQTYDNKYVQYRLMDDDWSTDTDDWAICDEGVYIENPEWVRVVTDNANRVLYGVKRNGKFYFGTGCPPQVREYVSNLLGTYSASDYADVMTFLGNLIDGDTLASLLATKVDKAAGKSLIDADFASSQAVIENPEFFQVTVDKDGRILDSLNIKGLRYIHNLHSETIDALNDRIDAMNKYGVVDLDGKGTAVGDGFTMTSCSCPHLQIDKETGICYSTWMTHPTEYGESHGYLSLLVFPGTQPFNCESFSIVAIGDEDENGNVFTNGNGGRGVPYESNCLIYYLDEQRRHPIVRCLFSTEGECLYYRDFNPLTKEFLSLAKEVQFINPTTGNSEVLTGTKIKAWVNENGGTWVKHWKLLFTDYIDTRTSIWNDGDYIYSVLTGNDDSGSPVIVKSDDYFATITLVAVNPTPVHYECQMSKLGNTFYFLYRVKNVGVKFNTTNNFVSYSETVDIPNTLTERSQILNNNGSIYLVIPTNDCPNPIKGGRRAYHIYKGIGSNFSKYEDLFWFFDKFGLVYISANFINGRLIMCYSTNLLMLGAGEGVSYQEGKSTGMYYIMEGYYDL